MKNILIIAFAGIFVMPHLCNSYASVEAKINKHYEPDAVREAMEVIEAT